MLKKERDGSATRPSPSQKLDIQKITLSLISSPSSHLFSPWLCQGFVALLLDSVLTELAIIFPSFSA
jgi:hypothetical protein